MKIINIKSLGPDRYYVEGYFYFMDHQKYIRRTLELAKLGFGKVSPNPRVGAVVVKNDQIISEGYHSQLGGPHAEITAIQKLLKDEIQDSYLYVNLEPCSHHGKTPPCTQAIIEAGIDTVVYGMVDPNPLVKGRGLQTLREAGIQVIGPILEEECLSLNVGFVKSIIKSIPWITVKIAQTLDGKIALNNGESKWITSELSRRLVHQWRSEHDAVLVGIHTVLQDNPLLNVRMIDGPSSKRLILDANLRIPISANLIQNNPELTLIIASENIDHHKKTQIEDLGVQILQTSSINGMLDLASIWPKVIDHGICSILVEGGQQVFSTFLESGWTDVLKLFIAPKLFGQGLTSIRDLKLKDPELHIHFSSYNWKSIGQDMLFEGTMTCLQDWLKKPE